MVSHARLRVAGRASSARTASLLVGAARAVAPLSGAAVGPTRQPPHATARHADAGAEPTRAPLPAGLAVSQRRLHAATGARPIVDAARTGRAASSSSTAPTARRSPPTRSPTTRSCTSSSSAATSATYAHVHPDRDAAGTWHGRRRPPLPPGSYRVYADFVPAGGTGVTLAADLAVPGDYAPGTAAAPPSTSTTVDGYEVTLRRRRSSPAPSPSSP